MIKFLKKRYALATIVALAFLCLYSATAQRGVSWQDSGEFQYRVLVNDLVWNSGIARAHPGYVFSARCFWLALRGISSFLDLGVNEFFPVTLFSGFGMSVALFFLVRLVQDLTGNPRAAVAAAVTLGLSHMCWWMSAVAEVYTWSLAFLLAEAYIAFNVLSGDFARRPQRAFSLPLLFLVNGLHFSFHNFALLDFSVYAVMTFILLRGEPFAASRKWGIAFLSIVAFAIGAMPIAVLAVRELCGGGAFLDVVKSVLFGTDYTGAVLGTGRPRVSRVLFNYALAGLSLLSPLWWTATERGVRKGCSEGGPFFRTLSYLTLLHFVFWVRYFVADQATFILPTLALLAVWLGVGADIQLRKPLGESGRLSMLGLVLSASLQVLFVAGGLSGRHGRMIEDFVLSHRGRELPHRKEVSYWFRPWKHDEHSAERFLRDACAELSKAAGEGRPTLYADWTTAPLFMGLQDGENEDGLFRDFRLLTPWTPLPREIEGPFFIVTPRRSYAPSALLEGAYYHLDGVLWRRVEK